MAMASTAEAITGTQQSVRVESRRFGAFDVPADRILRFAHGLVGFPSLHRFVILDHRPGSPFKWMLCLDDPELAFAVVDPGHLVADYQPPLEATARLVGADPEHLGLFVIVTIPSDPTAMTVNLLAPVVVDLQTRAARQVVLEDARFEASYPVLERARRPVPKA
jgi:flagellar assembly factor FliW